MASRGGKSDGQKSVAGKSGESNKSKKEPRTIFSAAAPRLISSTYLEHAVQATVARDRLARILLDERKWQIDGWDDNSIDMFIRQLASMDSNNYSSKTGVGEREGRIYSPLVSKRHFSMVHGIGRSGDLGEPQPKAVGSSIMSSLVNALIVDALRSLVSTKVCAAFLSPMATGMSITLVLLALRKEKPKAKFVVWPRIDQKSCFKCIVTAGLEPLVLDGKVDGDEIRTNLVDLKSTVKAYGSENILCVLTTTSCFAPRVPDSLEVVSKLCRHENIFHVVNNAYGLQNSGCVHEILEGSDSGRIDVFVQSTDKNFMVPVGGAIIAGFNKDLIQKIRQTYPGRASSSQVMDLLITMLSMGTSTYAALLIKIKENYAYLKLRLEEFATRNGERVLHTPHNRFSVALSLKNIAPHMEPVEARSKVITQLGSMLFRRHVLGARVITGNETRTVEGHQFVGWGSHCNNYPVPYLTAAAAIGMVKSDVDCFMDKLEEVYKKLSKSFGFQRSLDCGFDEFDLDD